MIMRSHPFFIDANLVMYSLGGPHPLREPCKRVLKKIASGEITTVTNAEILQEILHRYFSLGKPDLAEIAYASTVQLCMTVFPVTVAETDKALEWMKKIGSITSRDAIHAATMIHHGIKEIISTDSHFDLIPGIKRVVPGAIG